MAGLTPRRWQVEALPLCLAAMRSREARVVQACTGSGKSILQAMVVREVLASPRLAPTDCVVVTCPTEALVEQLAATIAEHGHPATGRYYGRRKECRGRRVIVACTASLGALVDAMQIHGMRCVAWLADEVHRGVASEAQRETIARLDPLTRLAFTATPWRTTEAIPGWTAPLLYSYRLSDALGDGVVVPPDVRYWTGEDGVDVDTALLAMLAAHAPEGPGLVSAMDIADARATAEQLSAAGWPALAIYGTLPAAEQAARIERLRSGELRALVHVRLLQEGVDLPWLRWLGMRVRRTALLQVQEVGRILRTHPGKSSALVLDPLCQSPVAAFYSAEALGAWEDEAAAELVEREPQDQPAVRLPPLAVAVDTIRAWTLTLRALAPAAGLSLSAPRTTSRGPSTDAQRAALGRYADRPRGVCSRFPAAVRDALRDLCRAAAALDRVTASELLDVLVAAGQEVGRSATSGSWSRAWRWPDSLTLPTIDPNALAALDPTR